MVLTDRRRSKEIEGADGTITIANGILIALTLWWLFRPFNARPFNARPTDCPSRSRAQGRGDPGGRAVEFAAIGKLSPY
jgi:hypothetical protein